MKPFRLVAASVVLAAALVGCGDAPDTVTTPSPTLAAPTVAEPPTAPTAPAAPRQVGRPTSLEIPAIGVREPLTSVGLKVDGAMQTPDFGAAAWYDRGPRPGAAGPAVVVAHVHGPAGDDVFADLHRLRRGDLVTVRRTDGSTTFVVDAVERAPKEALPYGRIWKDSDRALLRLITCGGIPDPVTRVYPDNTIVYAHAVSARQQPAAHASR